MQFTALSLSGAYEITPAVYEDERGVFYRFYCEREFTQIGHNKKWVQLNHSYTEKAGTVRGMHFQLPPCSEIKMVRCIAGKIMDVIIDLREGSPGFLQWQGVELSAENRKLLYIPEGFAHGFQTLTDHCELLYHHTAFYTAGAEGGVRYDDPGGRSVAPAGKQPVERDKTHPLLSPGFKGVKLI